MPVGPYATLLKLQAVVSFTPRIPLPFFERVLIVAFSVFYLYPIRKACIIDRVKSKCLTPIEYPTRERNRYEGGRGDRVE